MGRLSKEKARRLYDSTVRLLRYTRWKCGRLERAIINFLWNRRGREAKVEEIVLLGIRLGSRDETLSALRRLQTRRIVKIGELEG
jgi:hypothetical protein